MNWQIPTSDLDIFVRSVEIASFLPGRIRLYSRKLVNNPAAVKEIKGRLQGFAELESVEINPATGSILITYDPTKLARNPQLKKAEDYIKTHVKRR